MAERHFTPEEANALLEQVRPVAESLVAHRRAFTVAAARRARRTHRISGNGGDFDPRPSLSGARVGNGEGVTLTVHVPAGARRGDHGAVTLSSFARRPSPVPYSSFLVPRFDWPLVVEVR